MNLFFLLVNNINMKRIILLFLFLCIKVNAIENIRIDNEDIIPKFNKETKVYNFFTYNDEINIEVENSKDETTDCKGVYYLNEMNNEIKITTSNNEKYIIHVSKNYDKNKKDESYIKDISILGYDLNYDRNVHEYSITINDEENLNINCELSNDSDSVSVIGNGNFNRTDNIIKIVLNDSDEYIIHAYKTQTVSKIEKEEKIKEMSKSKKEIVKIIISTISCILIFLFYKLLFKKHI